MIVFCVKNGMNKTLTQHINLRHSDRGYSLLEDPLVLIAGDPTLVIFTLPTLIMRSLFPHLIKVNDFLL